MAGGSPQNGTLRPDIVRHADTYGLPYLCTIRVPRCAPTMYPYAPAYTFIPLPTSTQQNCIIPSLFARLALLERLGSPQPYIWPPFMPGIPMNERQVSMAKGTCVERQTSLLSCLNAMLKNNRTRETGLEYVAKLCLCRPTCVMSYNVHLHV